ncbi:MAG TPA: M23 family metallopeptidase [Gaiellaceae bacterium]|nr:M23 family metallopeptidase [Gaiellaceae bacterium]
MRILLVVAALLTIGVLAVPARSDLPNEPSPLSAALGGGPYVFPVFGAWSYADNFSASSVRPGIDIAGSLCQPVVACADGTIVDLGYDQTNGNHLRVLDARGNQFVYSDLSAFSSVAANGVQVKAGQVLGFLGATGSAGISVAHVHFEIRPVSGLYLGAAGATDPLPYLHKWTHEQELKSSIAAGFAAAVPRGATVPEPGALLLGYSDISTGNARPFVMQTLVASARLGR